MGLRSGGNRYVQSTDAVALCSIHCRSFGIAYRALNALFLRKSHNGTPLPKPQQMACGISQRGRSVEILSFTFGMFIPKRHGRVEPSMSATRTIFFSFDYDLGEMHFQPTRHPLRARPFMFQILDRCISCLFCERDSYCSFLYSYFLLFRPVDWICLAPVD